MATPMATSSELKASIIIGDLVIFSKEIVGNGAFGTVFKGEWQQKPCAAKMLNILGYEVYTGIPITQQGGVQEEALSRFNKECEFMKTLRHPNIVTYYDTLFHPGSNLPVLVMELMNTSLCQYITTHADSLSERVQLNLCHNIATALEFLHSKNIIHRDLCGENILLNYSADDIPVAKVTDFGISRKNIDMTHSLTAIHHRPGYLPPEAPEYPTDYDSSLDIFMFGAVMSQIAMKCPAIKSKKEREKLLTELGEVKHPLNVIVCRCVDGSKENRLKASVLCASLHSACEALANDSTKAGYMDKVVEEMQQLCPTQSEELQLQVEVKELTSTEVKISWCLPYGGARNVKLYIYQGRNVVYEENMNQRLSEITKSIFVPEKLYTATVVAEYDRGRRETGSKSFRTSKPQLQLQVDALTSTRVKISWHLPYGGARSIKFSIYGGCNTEAETMLAGDKTDITVNNIIPGKQYTTKVVAHYYGGNTESGSKDFQTMSSVY